MITTKEIGQKAEKLAQAYLAKRGLKLLKQNYQCRCGEIDLIMQDGDYISFIEVRYRRNTNYGDGMESVNLAKQQKIIATATYYLQQHQLLEKVACRFDVIAITEHNQEIKIEWIKDAFT